MRFGYFRIKMFLEEELGLRIYRRGTPRGLDLFNDIEKSHPGFKPNIVLDVGANIGQSSLRYRKQWRDARIHAFEPVTNTFRALERNVAGKRITCHQIALSDRTADVDMTVMRNGLLSSIEPDVFFSGDEIEGVETVKTVRLDDWLSQNGLAKVDFLKIDTEGHDIKVLRGADRLLAERRATFVQVETWITALGVESTLELLEHLYAFNYRLISVRDQESYPARDQFLCNMVFVSQQELPP